MATASVANSKRAFERAMRLAVVSGLRSALGVALVEAAYDRPNRKNWALAAMGEMAADKLPFMPSRANFLVMLPRAVAGAYVAQEVMKKEGVEDPWVGPMGGLVAAGVSQLAPRVRGLLHFVGFPGVVLGLAEDYLALKVGGEALGMTMDDLKSIGAESIDDLKTYFAALGNELNADHAPAHPAGAGSM